MQNYSLTHLSDEALDREFPATLRRESGATAVSLAHLAEFDARKRYLPAGYGSMWDYCVQRLLLSEDATAKRIQAARTARRFPTIFPLLAEGRLTLGALCELAAHLTETNAAELLAAAAGRTRVELRELMASRRRPTVSASPDAAATVCAEKQHAPAHVESGAATLGLGPGGSGLHAPAHVTDTELETVPLNLRIDREAEELLRYAQMLLSHLPDHRDAAKLFKRAMQALVKQEEARRFGSANQRKKQRGGSNPRYIPADVRRRVFIRDEGRCRYTSDSGHVCGSRHQIEFEHRITVADGGLPTDDNTELLCRAHNQLRAEQRFGKEHISARREQAQRARAEARQAKEREVARQAAREKEHPHKATVIRMLQVNFRMASLDAAEIASVCDQMPGATLEECVRAALKRCGPSHGARREPATGKLGASG